MMVLGQKKNQNTFWVTFEKYSFSSPACENTNSVSLAKGQVMCIFNKQPRKFWWRFTVLDKLLVRWQKRQKSLKSGLFPFFFFLFLWQWGRIYYKQMEKWLEYYIGNKWYYIGNKWYYLDLHWATSEWSFHRPNFIKKERGRDRETQRDTKDDSNSQLEMSIVLNDRGNIMVIWLKSLTVWCRKKYYLRLEEMNSEILVTMESA